MATLPIHEVLAQSKELQNVFGLRQQAIPYLEEVHSFLKDVGPLLDEIDASIRESTKKMPMATSRLTRVTQATELATMEILNLIDASLLQLRETKVKTQAIEHAIEALEQSDTSLLLLLRRRLGDKDRLIPYLETVMKGRKDQRTSIVQALEAQGTILNEIREAANLIMLSLQVQDFTAQQIAAANQLIEHVRRRLARIHQMSEAEETPLAQMPLTSNPDAAYDPSGERQAAVDALVGDFQRGGGDDVQASIDTLFGDKTPAQPDLAEPPSQDAIDLMFQTPNASEETASEDDINQLFGAPPSPEEPISQDDINQMFSTPFKSDHDSQKE